MNDKLKPITVNRPMNYERICRLIAKARKDNRYLKLTLRQDRDCVSGTEYLYANVCMNLPFFHEVTLIRTDGTRKVLKDRYANLSVAA